MGWLFLIFSANDSSSENRARDHDVKNFAGAAILAASLLSLLWITMDLLPPILVCSCYLVFAFLVVCCCVVGCNSTTHDRKRKRIANTTFLLLVFCIWMNGYYARCATNMAAMPRMQGLFPSPINNTSKKTWIKFHLKCTLQSITFSNSLSAAVKHTEGHTRATDKKRMQANHSEGCSWKARLHFVQEEAWSAWHLKGA